MTIIPKRRRNDTAIITKVKTITPVMTLKEGDDGNIIKISNWNFSPVTDFINRSLVVYKKKRN